MLSEFASASALVTLAAQPANSKATAGKLRFAKLLFLLPNLWTLQPAPISRLFLPNQSLSATQILKSLYPLH